MKNIKTAEKMALVFIFFLALVIALTAVFYRWWSIPRPLIVDVENASIWTVQVRDSVLGEDGIPVTYVEGWDKKALLDCLSQCEINTPDPFTSKTFSLNEVEFLIKFDRGGQTGNLDACELRLGERYGRIVVNDVLYSVVNHETLKEGLRGILTKSP